AVLNEFPDAVVGIDRGIDIGIGVEPDQPTTLVAFELQRAVDVGRIGVNSAADGCQREGIVRDGSRGAGNLIDGSLACEAIDGGIVIAGRGVVWTASGANRVPDHAGCRGRVVLGSDGGLG